MIITYSTKHAEKSEEKIEKCCDHDNGKILLSTFGSPLLLKESNKTVLHPSISNCASLVIQSSNKYSDDYKESPFGTVVTFTQTSIQQF